jgi:hypothetical protein
MLCTFGKSKTGAVGDLVQEVTMTSKRTMRAGLVLLTIAIAIAGCTDAQDVMTPPGTPSEPTATSAPTAMPGTATVDLAVAISPTSGPPGTEVQVVATGFPAETEIEIGLGRQDSEYDAVTTAQTDAEGVLTARLAIPGFAEPEEQWVVVATTHDRSAQAVSNVFHVTTSEYEPQVAIAPASGLPGTDIEVVAEGFPANADVEIGIGRESSEYDVVSTLQTAGDGSLTAEATIPTYAEPDERWVVVVTTADRSVEAISNAFQVEQARYQATVAISPTSGPPGTLVDVVAQRFPPQTAVEIGIGRINSEYDVVATAQTNADGRLETQIAIPAFVEPEDHWVIVVSAEHQPVEAISEEFNVTEAATPTSPNTGLFTRTNIYLIALGDAGQAGKTIGCDDSVVPVEVEIEPTIAPLTAALKQLLAIETREYGESGLYNALYRSDLTLSSASVVDGHAIIRLSGTLTLGGVCDEPRVQAQLRETAVQYRTVSWVSVLINGTPLEELLSRE